MFCESCGKKIENPGKFCEFCGGETGAIKNQVSTMETPPLADTTATAEEINTPSGESPKAKFELTKRQKIYGLIVGVLIVLAFVSVQLFQYYNNPEQIAKRYVKAYNSSNYERLSKYYEDFMESKSFTKEMIIKSLEDVAENNTQPKIRIVEKGKRRDQILQNEVRDELALLDKNKFFLPVELDYGNNNKRIEVLELYKDIKNKWQVPYPYSLNTLSVQAPMGTIIFLDNAELGQVSGRYTEYDSILPGKHTVEMKFFNDIQPPHLVEIYMPDESYVESPYGTFNISINTVEDAEIIFDDVAVDTTRGYAYIENVLEGKHSLTVKANEDMVRPLETNLEVGQGNTHFSFYEFEPKDSFEEEIMGIIKGYNNGLINAYINYAENEDDPLAKIRDFTGSSKLNNDQYSYNSYNYNKKIVNQNYEIEDSKIILESLKNIYVNTVENWHTKEEIKEFHDTYFTLNGQRELERKNKIENSYELINENGVWKITHITTDSVNNSYLDSDGSWVNY